MKIINVPEGYEVYQNDKDQYFILDQINADLIREELDRYGDYWAIPNDKEVECFYMLYDKTTNSYNPNLKNMFRVRMNLLSSVPVGIK